VLKTKTKQAIFHDFSAKISKLSNVFFKNHTFTVVVMEATCRLLSGLAVQQISNLKETEA
jgi:hypothetical protein